MKRKMKKVWKHIGYAVRCCIACPFYLGIKLLDFLMERKKIENRELTAYGR